MNKNWFKKIQTRNEKLLKSGKRYHTIRDIFLILSILQIVGGIILLFTYEGIENLNGLFDGVILCLLLAYIFHIRSQHIDSLVFYHHVGKESKIDLSKIEIPEESIKSWIQRRNPF
jgi:hypothetical protein